MARISALCIHGQTQDLMVVTAQELGLDVEAKLTAVELALAGARTAVARGARVLVAEERLWTVLARVAPVPVVPCPAGPWDVAGALARCPAEPVAVVHFGPDSLDLETLGAKLGIQVREVLAPREQHAVRALLLELKDGGVRAVVGGEGLVALARREGLYGQPVKAGPAAVRAALWAAVRLAEAMPLSLSAQEVYYRAAVDLPAGVVVITPDGSWSWGGKAPEVADRVRAMVARGQRSEVAIARSGGPGIRVESLGEGRYAVHDLSSYQEILAKEAYEAAFGGGAQAAASGESVVVSVGTLEAMQDQIIAQLAQRSGNRTQLARRLGISRTTLWKKLRELAPKGGS
ncbi:MAG: PrpR N-terminal domain-containing protein [Bacillota bacterium]